jgi:hypothetical protein
MMKQQEARNMRDPGPLLTAQQAECLKALVAANEAADKVRKTAKKAFIGFNPSV